MTVPTLLTADGDYKSEERREKGFMRSLRIPKNRLELDQ
jgi:hypothetical protein